MRSKALAFMLAVFMSIAVFCPVSMASGRGMPDGTPTIVLKGRLCL